MLKKKLTLRRSESLSHKKEIEEIFLKGKAVREKFLKLLYLFEGESKQGTLPLVMFAVSKRNMKSAVKRNRIKRQFREAYRLQKPEFLDELERTMLNRFPLRLVFMYQHSNGELSFNEAKSSVRNALMKLIRKNECKTPNDEQAQ